MDSGKYKAATIAWYQNRLKEHGQGIKALSSGTEERRAIRFGVLTGVGISPGCPVLDVGCGFADYYAYLEEQRCKVSYTGIDLVPELIERARRSHPDIELQVRDLQADPVTPGSFDYVVCSQTFNLRFGDESNSPLIEEMMRLMF